MENAKELNWLKRDMRQMDMRQMNAMLAAIVGLALLFAIGCGGGSSSHSNTVTTTGSNVQAITVNAGPAGNYANGAFTSVTLCVPGTTTCQTISGVLVDTGSSGLRLLSSALSGVSLPQQKASNGNPVVECLPFVSGVTWGPVETADIQISGEKASSVQIQVISGTAYPIPTACANQGSSQNTLTALGANGILGVGLFAQDCGDACATTGATNPALYYECPSSGCVVTAEALSQQVANPVASFPTDNNGVIVELPAASAPEATLSGSLIFGIGTQSNNALGSATVYATDANFNFITTYKGHAYNTSFLDSGSNGLFFLTAATSAIATCTDATSFYCPSSTQNLSAVNQGANGVGSSTVNFSVANADSLFNSSSDTVLGELAGPNSLPGFDWGLPFFYGRNVFTAIEGKSTPGGVGPYWAY
jgi:Protein of unknown function (DUF3443)